MSINDNTIEYTNLLNHKARLDKFFTKFLDTVGDQMDSHNTDTPVWKLYKSKLKEYDDVCTAIKAKEYWFNKNSESLKSEQLSSIETAKIYAVEAHNDRKEVEKAIDEGTHIKEADRIDPKKQEQEEIFMYGQILTPQQRIEKANWDMTKPHDIWNPTKDVLDGPLFELVNKD